MNRQSALREAEVSMFDPAAETMPREALAAMQLGRLKRTLEHAYANVPHYRRAFEVAGVKPESLASLGDIVRFPFTLKTDLRDNYPFGMFAVPRKKYLGVSSGYRL